MDVLGNTAPDDDPEVQRLLEEARAREHTSLAGRQRTVGWALAAALVGAIVAMAVLLHSDRSLDVGLAIALTATFAISSRVEFHVGIGWAVASELAFVPMLFLLPPQVVPLLVAAALPLARLPEFAGRRSRPGRAVLEFQNGWYAVGPALVFTLAGVGAPSWGDWPVYLGALASQFAFDLVRSVAYDGAIQGALRPTRVLAEVRAAYLVDAMLAPVGLVVAFASASSSWAFTLVLPLVLLIRIFSREREARIENALVLSSAYQGTAHLLAELLSTSHEYTGHHSRSVVILAHQVGERLGLSAAEMREIEFGALLHDIGKWSVPNEIINKPGRLTDDEMELMRTHTVEGESMLERIGGVLGEVGHVVRSHHEFWNGRGYPDGLMGEEIPVAARVISACDAFNAMTTNRSYRAATSLQSATEELRKNAGTQFDPRVVEALVAIVSEWPGLSAAEQVDRALEAVA